MSAPVYRLLNDGELIQASDTVLADDCRRWLPVERWLVRRPWHEALNPVRRVIQATPPVVVVHTLSSARGDSARPRERTAFEAWTPWRNRVASALRGASTTQPKDD